MGFAEFWEINAQKLLSNGVTAVYTPSAGDPVSCYIHIAREFYETPEGFQSQNWTGRHVVTVDTDTIGKEPDVDETFTISTGNFSGTWTVKEITENNGVFAKAVVKNG